ncbi:MAG: DUF3365 domain-containing protein [Nitrospinae bacterium]|nr:DUF3365 domain-containing protein [Nitrospinota bacterium]
MEEYLRKHTGKILFSIIGILALCILALIAYISKASLNNTLNASVANAASTINQFKVLRGYYTEQVVAKVKAKGGFAISYDHAKEDAIPLPATMVHELSGLLGKDKNGLRLKLYSAFPFPHRKDRVLDDFARTAVDFLQRNPEKTFVRVEAVDGQESVRVAIADRLTAEACVNCHNSHPESPKKDWKLNDARGVLEVVSPIGTQVKDNERMLAVVIGITSFAALLVALLVAGVRRFLRSIMQTERETAKVVSMMENTPKGIMFADRDSIMRYLNPESRNILRRLEKHLPENMGEATGKSIDAFHQNPGRVRKIVSDPRNLPHRATIQVGPERIDLQVTAVYDQNREFLGPMVAWEIVTEKVKTEAEMARVVSMVENNPASMMYADRNGILRYVNPGGTALLRKLEKYLPARADAMVGQSMDIFHKNPAAARRIVSDPKNLPYKSLIQIGPETLDLTVSAIFDNQNDYLGPMVTWEAVTERVAAERNSKDLAERELQQARELTMKVDSLLEVVSATVKGDLTRPVTVSGNDAIGKMGEGLSGLLAHLRKSISVIAQNAQALGLASGELKTVSAHMGKQANESSSEANVATRAAEQVSQNIQSVASATSEMSASILEISRNAHEAAKVASTAVKLADTANVSISKLGESSAEIGQVIKVITSIAEQTNLLALNATIEAARAGEAGKGFAVVANEVKELAKETGKATEDISQKIKTIQSDTGNAVDAIGEIAMVINQISDISNTIAGAVEEQTGTTAEISRHIAEAAKGSGDIAQNISRIAKATETNASDANDARDAADAMLSMAEDLQKNANTFAY